MHITWISNSMHVGTGYGVQTKYFAPLLKERGYGVACADMYGQEGFVAEDRHGIKHLPRLTDDDFMMSNVIGQHMQRERSDVALTFLDAFAVPVHVYGKLNWCAWAPVDSTPISPSNARALAHARWIWAMSQHGMREMIRAGYGEKTMYVPLATDTEVFKPVDRAQARAKLGKEWSRDLTGKFLVVMNSANKGRPSRKGFYEALKAFTMFSKNFEDALLYIHTDVIGLFGGEPLAHIVDLVGCDPKKLIFPNQYDYNMGLLNESYLNYTYNAADVFLSTSHGEGFGIPILEAQAAGCPVIVTDCTAMTELCFSGWLVRKGTDFMNVPGAVQRLPDVEEVATALRSFHALEQRAICHYRDLAREKALEYDYRAIFRSYMKPALERMERDLDRSKEQAAQRELLRERYAIRTGAKSAGEHPDADAQPAGADDKMPRQLGADAQ